MTTEEEYRAKYGYLAQEPLKIEDWVNYENMPVACAYCGAWMPHAPFPTNSSDFTHRPRCGKCGSFGTYPVKAQEGA